jgi:branched-chain amino acid transport system ATP-binding protein
MNPLVLLETVDLNKHFGALQAVKDVNLRIEEKTIHSVIGPNGAGKTTLFNAVAGVFPPTSGRILFQGKDIARLKIYERSRLGIGRSYQVTSIFPELTVRENIRLAVQSRGDKNFHLFRNASKLEDVESRTESILGEVGLKDMALDKAGAVSYGYQRSLEVGIALATHPILLLLDEPTSGMPPDEARRMMHLIKRIAQGLTVLLIEHHMEVVMTISDRITVLQQGKVIAEGRPEEVQKNETVKKAYLGGFKDAAS